MKHEGLDGKEGRKKNREREKNAIRQGDLRKNNGVIERGKEKRQ